jgi:hypothetical protein
MGLKSGLSLVAIGLAICAASLVFAIPSVLASDHQALNGTWRLIPARSELGGEPAVQTGSVTISDRQRNVYVSRDFTYDGDRVTVSTNFSTDGPENSSIRQGASFKSKAKWEGKELRVTSTRDNITSTERYSLSGDGTLMLVVERPGHRTITLFFERQPS